MHGTVESGFEDRELEAAELSVTFFFHEAMKQTIVDVERKLCQGISVVFGISNASFFCLSSLYRTGQRGLNWTAGLGHRLCSLVESNHFV